MLLSTSFEEFNKKKALPIYSSGDKTLDELLPGGFRHDLVYLLYGDRKIITNILQKFAAFQVEDIKSIQVFLSQSLISILINPSKTRPADRSLL